jgi:TonB family protein
VTTTEDWTKWESQVVNGVFPLLQFLGKSDHSVVFLTESQGAPNAAIKLIPADPMQNDAQLSNWRIAAALSHAHLIRLLDFGTCQLGGHPFLFVVMEYAEQTLAQILPHRALSADEVHELLLPSVDALAFLHRNNLVHHRLKPPNFLVVNDQLKLASDTICPAGESSSGIARNSPYDPPEAGSGVASAAGDIWALGTVIVEALTQSPTAPLPATLAPEYSDIVRRCLSHNPADRPTISDFEALFKPAPQPPVVVVPAAAPAARQSPKRQPWVPVALGIVLVVAVWAVLHLIGSHAKSHQAAANSAAAVVSQNPNPPASEPPAPAPTPTEGSRPVLHQEIPDVSRSARESIHGHIKVAVRVTVDRSGTVVDEAVEDPGSSRYFARVASAAARKWKFAPADNQNSREWLLRFEFSRDGTTGRASPRT